MNLYSPTYSIPYVLFALFILAMEVYSGVKRKDKTIYLILIIALSIFLGLRGFVLTDFISYYPFYRHLNTITNLTEEELFRFEPGFIYYSSFIKTIFKEYYIWVFINTLIDILVLNYIFKKYSISIYLSWFFFIVYMGILIEFNLFRNIKAIDLFLLSLPYIQKRKFWKFLIINLIGATMHLSALLYIPTYFFISKKISKKVVLIIFIITNIIFLFHLFPTTFIFNSIGQIFPEFKALMYVTGSEGNYGISLGYLERTVVFILCYIYYKRLAKNKSSNIIFCNSFFCYYILFHSFADVPTFTSRLPLLFIYSYWIIIPNLMGLIRSSYKISWYSLIILFGIIKIITGQSSILYKYDNIITGIESAQKRELIIVSNPKLVNAN